MSGSKTPIALLTEALVFPAPENAGPEGLLAAGGDLSTDRLLLAYRMGIFPWFNEDSLILWWSPDPRMVLFPNELKISKSMRSVIRKNQFQVTKNRDFAAVVAQCASIPRKDQSGTWITERMEEAYLELHKAGHAVSYEVWEGGNLVGGLYGIELGSMFCGESMFSTVSNASKVGFIHMVKEQQNRGSRLIDCQIHNQHLESLGAREIPRAEFLKYLPPKDC